MGHDLFLGHTDEILREILHVLRDIRHRLEPKFTLNIIQKPSSNPRFWEIYRNGDFWKMAAITQGQSAVFFLTATASDNSTPVFANTKLTADDPNVVVTPDTTDPTLFTVQVPASDTQTEFNLSASADLTSNTVSTPQTVTASLPVTITPGEQPVTFQLAINQR